MSSIQLPEKSEEQIEMESRFAIIKKEKLSNKEGFFLNLDANSSVVRNNPDLINHQM